MSEPREVPRVVRGLLEWVGPHPEDHTEFLVHEPTAGECDEGKIPVSVLIDHSTGVGPLEGWMAPWVSARIHAVIPDTVKRAWGCKGRLDAFADSLVAAAISEILGEDHEE